MNNTDRNVNILRIIIPLLSDYTMNERIEKRYEFHCAICQTPAAEAILSGVSAWSDQHAGLRAVSDR